jgi:hypothetical protein
MEYNSKREELIIPEYGRHVQGLIRHARTIENRDERQHFIERIVDLMMQMHPQNRNLEDHRDKLWKHVFQIAEYDLDVTPPSGELPKPEDRRKKPERVPYPSNDAKFRHYGNNVQRLIVKAIQMTDSPKKDGFVEVIGSYMKLAYRTWNKEHYVSDDVIIEDLKTLSHGKLIMVEDASLNNFTKSNNNKRQRSSSRSGRDRDSQQKSGSNGKGGRGQMRRRRRK